MSVAYLDCNAGISGNMFLGALIDLGYPFERFKTEIGKLPLPIPEFKIEKVSKKGIAATWFETNLVHEHQHRNLSQIIDIIMKAGYSQKVTDNAVRCFEHLAEAEAKIHGVSIHDIHFHEVGAADAIIDIVGACLGIDYFKIDQIMVSPIRMGFGTVKCAHGMIPVPAPATLELLKNFTIFTGEYEGEWTTPTGAAILKTFAKVSDLMPKMTLERIGYGAGTSERPIANIHRIILGKADQIGQKDHQVVLETNIDDLNPELYGFLGEALLKNGALDFYFTSIYMKKGRPGILVSVIVPPENVSRIEDLLFTQTSTLGIRKYQVERLCLAREYQTVDLKGCRIKIKTALKNGEIINYAPEYEDCLQAAQILNRPLKDVYDEAKFQFRKMFFHEGSC
ncbi:MAG: nickel pincer cofactor biosynthesis protein LarC [Bacteroidota bacterium]